MSGTSPDPPSDETTHASGQPDQAPEEKPEEKPAPERPREFGGRRKGLEPTRYGDWEKDGRCIDF